MPTLEPPIDEVLGWCTSVLGPVKLTAEHSKTHGGHESSTYRLNTSQGFCYLKIHRTDSHWHNEVHAYEKWAGAFGDFAPRLLAVREKAPLALIVSEILGQILERTSLPRTQEQSVWRSAGAALAALHDLSIGNCFGPCLRDGSCAETFPKDAIEHIHVRLNGQIDKAVEGEYINNDELATLRAACKLLPVFKSEQPVPCHRDYCAANWLLNENGDWKGVIDFEFAHWDMRVTDFSRDPDWYWIHRPDLYEALFEGYGRPLTSVEERQLLVTRAEYALGAILWGHDHAFDGFEREGHEALAYLAPFVK